MVIGIEAYAVKSSEVLELKASIKYQDSINTSLQHKLDTADHDFIEMKDYAHKLERKIKYEGTK